MYKPSARLGRRLAVLTAVGLVLAGLQVMPWYTGPANAATYKPITVSGAVLTPCADNGYSVCDRPVKGIVSSSPLRHAPNYRRLVTNNVSGIGSARFAMDGARPSNRYVRIGQGQRQQVVGTIGSSRWASASIRMRTADGDFFGGFWTPSIGSAKLPTANSSLFERCTPSPFNYPAVLNLNNGTRDVTPHDILPGHSACVRTTIARGRTVLPNVSWAAHIRGHDYTVQVDNHFVSRP